jgi:asparagine synthase (glutamine-hydrolysing)
MSGFFLAEAGAQHFDVERRFHFVQRDHDLPWKVGQCSSWLIRQDEENLWSPAYDHSGEFSLAIYGRIRLEPAQWSAAESLPLKGGLAARHLLDCWLKGGETSLLEGYNGAAVIILWDAANRHLHLWTDRAGVVPVYTPDENGFALSSHPDVLADWLTHQGRPPELDLESLAEILSTGGVSPPYCFYKAIRLLDAASHFVWEFSQVGQRLRLCSQTNYWSPPAIDHQLGLEEATAGIAAALRAACQRQTPGKTALLLSGGADSRGLLFAHTDPASIQCLTFCDSENPEVARAREVATVAGAPHEILFRDPEHYGLGALHTVRVTGGMGSIKDAHFQGFQKNFEAHAPSSLVTGCYADYLLKGLALNRQPYQLMGRALPLEKPAAYNADFYQPHYPLPAKWEGVVTRRRDERFGLDAALRYARNPRDIEDLRVRPLTREADAVGRLFLLGTQSWDPIFVDKDLLDFYGRLSPALKINSRAFAPAVLRLLPKSAHAIPNNNEGQLPLGTPPWLQLSAGAAGLIRSAMLRRIKKTPEQLASWCSWPNFAYYLAHSEVLGQMTTTWSSAEKDIFGKILGFDPSERPRARWIPETSLFLRLLTLKLWLGLRGYR